MNPQAPAPATPAVTAASPQAPTAVNLQAAPTYDTAGTLAAIRSYYQIPEQTATASAAAQGLAVRGQQENTANQIGAQYARENAQRSAEASSYRLQADLKGGPSKIRNIYTGELVDPLQFSQLTGASPAEVFKNSQNKLDQTFAQDYQNYQEYMQAALNPTSAAAKQTVTDFQGAHPQLKNMTPEQLRQQFMQSYGAYFGGAGQQSQTQFGLPYSPSAESYFAEYGARTGNQAAYQSGGGSNPYGVNLGQFAPQKK